MTGNSFFQQILSPGGGLLLIPFTRVVICCLFVTTFSVFIMGVARIHMFILSFLSAGMWFSLGMFERDYSKQMGATKVGVVDPIDNKNRDATTKRAVPGDVSASKRVD
mmetsp:Transcript_456/g.773  ORF Transcript_456/g.773 Transcript_456/m.773 type:complete len:108 (-) Transcript_456:1359-1682(-)